jgi:hypothetical protein
VWERFQEAGEGQSIKGTAHFSNASSASILLCNSRQDALYNSSDIIFDADVIDALDVTNGTIPSALEVALWLFTSGKAIPATLNASGDGQENNTALSTPLLSVSPAPEAVEIITVAPFQAVGTLKIASLGLVDKYAGLAVIKGFQSRGQQVVI